MANSDKNILITPNVSAATGTYPNIKFNGANNTPITLSVLDDGTVSFSGTAGQLFSVSDGLSGTIFSVNDISGIPSIEVLDTGLVKLNQYNGSTVFGASAAIQNSSSVNAKVSISTASVSTPGLIIKPVSGQTANLAEFYNGSGVFISGIRHDGLITGQIQSPTIYGGTIVRPNTSSNIPILVRGAASQTGDLQQWQDSAESVMVRISSGGDIYAVSRSVLARFVQADNGAGAYIDLGFNNANSVSIVGRTSTTAPQLIVKAISSQTANLQEWQDSAGTVLSYMASNGHLQTPRLVITNGGNITDSAGTTPYFGFGSNQIAIYTRNAAYKGLIIQGSESQTANLQEWQNSSGTVLTNIDSAGRIFTKDYLTVERNAGPGGTVLAQSWSWSGGANWGLRLNQVYSTSPSGSIDYHFITRNNSFSTDTNVMFIKASGLVGFNIINQTSAQVFVNNSTAANVGLIVKGAASQTANLQEWQDSAGTILVKIAADGRTTFPGGYVDIHSGGNLTVRGSSAFSANASALIGTGYAGGIGLIIKGVTSQTANLQEWQDSSGNVKSKILANGSLFVGGGSYTKIDSTYGQVAIRNDNLIGSLTVGTAATSVVGIVVRPVASQTANLMEFQTSTGALRTIFDASGSLVIGNPATTSFINSTGGVGRISVGTLATVSSGIIVQGSASQTANLQEWQDDSGTAQTAISSLGRIISAQRMSIGSSVTSPLLVANINFTTGASDRIGLVVRGYASQTANLTEWQNSSGTVLSAISAYGGLGLNSAPSLSTYLIIRTGASSVIGQIIIGASGQTANLQEWQNSSGTVLAKVDASGNFVVNGVTISQSASSVSATQLGTVNNRVFLKEENSGGQLRLTKSTASAANNRATDLAQLYLRDGTTAGTLKLVIIAGTTGAETTILDNIPQS